MKRIQFSLTTLLILAALGPLPVAGAIYVFRYAHAPWWAIAGGAIQLAFWSAALIYVLRNGLPRKI